MGASKRGLVGVSRPTELLCFLELELGRKKEKPPCQGTGVQVRNANSLGLAYSQGFSGSLAINDRRLTSIFLKSLVATFRKNLPAVVWWFQNQAQLMFPSIPLPLFGHRALVILYTPLRIY